MGLVVRAAALAAAGSWCAVAATAARGTDVVVYNVNTSPADWPSPAGQVQYRLDDEPDWHGIPLAAWSPFVGSGGGSDTPPMLSPVAFPSGTSSLVPDGRAFQGVSPGYGDTNRKFIKSGFELSGLPLGGEIEFRLLGDLGAATFKADPLHPIWDVNQVQIKGVVTEGVLPAGAGWPCARGLGCLGAQYRGVAGSISVDQASIPPAVAGCVKASRSVR